MPVPDSIGEVPRVLMRDAVYERVRDWVVDGTLRPGEQLRDQDIAQSFKVSRTPVREALRRLEDEGFVETAANRWTRVTTLDTTHIRFVYPLIWSLEQLAVELAGPPLDPALLGRMADANQRLREGLDAGDAITASDADRAFHLILLESAGNPELVNVVNGLKLKLRRLEIAYFGGGIVANRSADEHDAILAALGTDDAATAAASVTSHWKSSLARVEAHADGR